MSLWAHRDGAGKRRLVAQLLSIRGVNESTVGRILRLLEPQQSLTKWAIHNVLSTQAESVVTHVKLPLMDGGEFSWPIACPQRSVASVLVGMRRVPGGIRASFVCSTSHLLPTLATTHLSGRDHARKSTTTGQHKKTSWRFMPVGWS